MVAIVADIVSYIASFLFVLALIGACAWLLRRFVLEGGGVTGARMFQGQKSRLGVVEGIAVDGRRRLILIRRDDVEHLILTGGPNDVVVETDIEPPKVPASYPKETNEPRSRKLGSVFEKLKTRTGDENSKDDATPSPRGEEGSVKAE